MEHDEAAASDSPDPVLAEPALLDTPPDEPQGLTAREPVDDDALVDGLAPLPRVRDVRTQLTPMQRADLLPPPEPPKVRAITTLRLDPWSPPPRKAQAGDMSQFGRHGGRTPK